MSVPNRKDFDRLDKEQGAIQAAGSVGTNLVQAIFKQDKFGMRRNNMPAPSTPKEQKRTVNTFS